MLELNVGIPKRDEMFDVLEDIISDDAEVDPISAQLSNVQYDEFFTTLNFELYLGVSSFLLLNVLVTLMHLKVMNKWTNKLFDDLLKLLKLAFQKSILLTLIMKQKI